MHVCAKFLPASWSLPTPDKEGAEGEAKEAGEGEHALVPVAASLPLEPVQAEPAKTAEPVPPKEDGFLAVPWLWHCCMFMFVSFPVGASLRVEGDKKGCSPRTYADFTWVYHTDVLKKTGPENSPSRKGSKSVPFGFWPDQELEPSHFPPLGFFLWGTTRQSLVSDFCETLKYHHRGAQPTSEQGSHEDQSRIVAFDCTYCLLVTKSH